MTKDLLLDEISTLSSKNNLYFYSSATAPKKKRKNTQSDKAKECNSSYRFMVQDTKIDQLVLKSCEVKKVKYESHMVLDDKMLKDKVLKIKYLLCF